MNFPIAERELRMAARSPKTYRGRLIICVVFGAITSWLYWASEQFSIRGTVAAQTFSFASNIALMMCVFSVSTTADALSSEKREGTLGLLFLTDLKAIDIVSGKLAAVGVATIYGLLAGIPILWIPVLMGGVGGESIFKTSLVLINSLFFALGAGLWISARSYDQKKTMNAAVWVAMSALWFVPGLGLFLHQKFGWATAESILNHFSPTYQMQRANPFGLGLARGGNFWVSLAITHALAWLALWRACAILPRQWQDRPAGTKTKWRERWDNLRFGSSEGRLKFRRRLLAVNAVHWLSSRERFAPFAMWMFVAFMFLGWVAFWIYLRVVHSSDVDFWILGIPAVMVLQLGLRLRVCSLSAETIARDRFSGALGMLLSTSMSIKDVVAGQLLTVRRTALGPAIASMVMATFLLIIGVLALKSAREPDLTSPVVVFAAMSLLFFSDMIAAFWTALWMACVSKTAVAAPGQAILRLLVLPWAIFFAGLALAGNLGLVRNGVDFFDVFIPWWCIQFLNNLFWTFHSRKKFYAGLRVAASERFQSRSEPVSWWRRFRVHKQSGIEQMGLSQGGA